MFRPSTAKLFSRVFRNNPKYSTVQPLADDLTNETSNKLKEKSAESKVNINIIILFNI